MASSASGKLGGGNSKPSAEALAARELNTHNPAVEAADGWGLNVDADTLNSRDQSLERKRTNDIEAMRHELITKKESQRGRRQAGQALPAAPPASDSVPAVQVSRYNGASPEPPMPSGPGGRNRTFDIESQTGGGGGNPVGFGMNPYGSSMTTTVAGGAAAAAAVQQQQQSSGYSVFPPPQRSSPPSSSQGNYAGLQSGGGDAANNNINPHPLQSAPSNPFVGRQRGASVSRPQPGSMPSSQGQQPRPF